MNDNNGPRYRFKFRFDFALEIGYMDAVRAAVTEASFAAMCRTKLNEAFSWVGFRTHNEVRSQRACPRYLLAGGIIRPKSRTPSPFLTDGETWFFPPESGLFWDLVKRVEVGVKPPKGVASAIYPASRALADETWAYPPMCVVHDAETGIAEVSEMAGAMKIVRDANAASS